MSSMDDLHDSSSIQEIIGENGDQETKMIVDQERKVFVGSLNWDTTEGVMSSLGGEPMDTDESGLLTDLEQNQQTVVFDDVGNEVSITATDDRAGVTVTAVSMPVTKTPRATKGKSTVATPTRMKPIQPNQGGPVVIPISNQASGLAQFITSIRPPAIPGAQQQVKVVRPGSVTTKFMPVKKPPAIAPAPSPAASGLVTKAVIMTSSGQQLVISSPVKSGVDHNQKSNTITLGPATGNVVNQAPQQIMLFSPIKQSPGKLVQVRPKPPSTSGTPIEIQSVSQQKDVKPLQIIRLVQTSNSLTPTVQTSGTTKAYTINRMPTISTITSNFSRAQTSTASSTGSVVTTQKILIPASAVKSSPSTGMIQSSSNTMQQAFITNSGGGQVIMLPAHMFQGQGSQSTASVNQIQIKPEPAGNGNVKHVTFSAASSLSSSATQRTSFVPIAPSPLGSQPTIPASQILAGLSGSKAAQNSIKSEGDANRPRKPCNCTKSQCLKLYCDCFANGEFCSSCNCINCANNLEHEEDRQKAIRQCLERNPHAFHPKIGKGRGDVTERRHTKGCNCRRSGCLKNYCECYEAKILCSDLCKCIGCKNYEDSYERKTLMHLADAAEVRSAQQSVASKAKLWGSDFTAKLPIRLTNDKMDRLHCSFITSDVLEATCQCLLATAEDGEKLKLSYSKIEERILDEFGSCLSKIIETANKARK